MEQLRLAAVEEEQGLVAWPPPDVLPAERKEVVLDLMVQALLRMHAAQGGGNDEPIR